MDTTRFQGIYPAVITPFDSSGEVAEEKLQQYTEYLVNRVDGLFVCGSYGSGPIMRMDQRKRVAELTVKTVNRRIPIIIHIGCADTESTIQLGLHAKELEVDAVAAVTPYYYKHTEAMILAYYRCLLDALDNIPLMAYNNPKYSNFCISAKLLSELAKSGLAGIKDSSANISLLYDYLGAVDPKEFLVLVGSQTHLVPAMVGGAHGCVSGLSNAFPEFIRDMYQACVRKDYSLAVRLQKKANALRSLTGEGIPIPFYHAVLPLLGIDLGFPRSPFQPLADQEARRIQTELAKIDLT